MNLNDLILLCLVYRKVLSYSNRAYLSKNVLSKRLFEIMSAKKTNLALSADVSETKELLKV